MNWKISRVILWPKDGKFARKEISFELDKINVIVGDSQTGKSSIIAIIDYCLCSGKCTIPVGPIRKTTGWFGILVYSGETEFLLARQEPGSQQATNQMYFEEGKNLVIPDRIVIANRTAEQVTNRINKHCNLPALDFSETPDDKKPYEGRPSFKDMLAFCFQSQHIIANPYTLFYQADTIEHKLKLRTVFPLALGLIQVNTLELQRRLSLLNEQLKEKLGVLDYKRKIRSAWESEVKGNYLKALEFGILKDTPFPEDTWKLEDFVGYLNRVPELAKTMKFPFLSEGMTSKIITYTTKTQNSELQIIAQLEEKSYRLSLLKSFRSTSTNYELAIRHQQARLEPVTNGWLESKLNWMNDCPICGAKNEKAIAGARGLIKSSSSIHEKVKQIQESKDLLDKEITEIEIDISELERQLNNIRAQLEALGREHDKIEKQRKGIEDMYRYVGRIEQNLKNLDETKIDSKLFQDIANLQDQVSGIHKELNATTSHQNRDGIMKRISQSINFYKEILKVEDADNPTEVDERQLTLKVTSKDNRVDHLWEIGSGSNWMGYHVSTILALHEYFLSLKTKNLVPTFIVFDQPSQAYFPELVRDNIDAQRKSDDLERVKAIFTAFSEFYKRTKNTCQIIVLEHASPEFWDTVSMTKQVGNRRWIKEDALIPNEWINDIKA
jgi:hypothetical protein